MSIQTKPISPGTDPGANFYSDLIKPEDLVRERPDLFSNAKLNWLIRQRSHNGLSDAGAVIKCGRTILIVRSKFYEWLLANKA